MSNIQELSTKEILLKFADTAEKANSFYQTFHNYSIYNQFLMILQNVNSPIATYKKWQSLGRQVKGGEKAKIELCVPKMYCKEVETPLGIDKKSFLGGFSIKKIWFTIEQTTGKEFSSKPIADNFDFEKCKDILNIDEIPFSTLSTNYNMGGYCLKNQIAINPLNPLKHKTFFHEVGHILLGHTSKQDFNSNNHLPHEVKEIQAELVAFICISFLGLAGIEESKHYIQTYIRASNDSILQDKDIKEALKVADKILKTQINKDEIQEVA